MNATPARSNKLGRRYLLAILGLTLAIVALLALLGVDRAAREIALAGTREEARAESAILAASIESELEKFSLVPLVLARDPEVRALLSGDAGQAAILNQRLAELSRQTGAAAIYIMDLQGTTLTASNWNRPDSFVGSNYRFRDYFKSALGEGSATQFALGTVSRRPGLYIAKRVDVDASPLGVIALKVEFDQLEASWRKATPGVFVTDATGTVLITSNPAWRFRGTRNGTTRTKPLDFAPSGGEMAVAPLIEMQQPLTPKGWELHLLADPSPRLAAASANGRLLLLLVVVALAVLGGGVAAVLRRRERMAEAAAQERTAKLRDQLQQANRLATLGQVTAGVGHEIRQPLAAIRVYAETGEQLIAAGDTKTAAENLGQIVALTDRVGRITEELRSFSRRGSREPRDMPLAQVVDGALLLLRDRMAQQGASLDLPDSGSLATTVRGEHVALEQVLVNLLQNALDATGQGGRIAIELERDEAAVHLTVADNGPGISAEWHDSLFQPFATTKDGGLGLGLVIAQEIMRGLGGDLIHRPAPLGARFTMVIPYP